MNQYFGKPLATHLPHIYSMYHIHVPCLMIINNSHHCLIINNTHHFCLIINNSHHSCLVVNNTIQPLVHGRTFRRGVRGRSQRWSQEERWTRDSHCVWRTRARQYGEGARRSGPPPSGRSGGWRAVRAASQAARSEARQERGGLRRTLEQGS
jgi:hypothetical protein